MLSLQVEKSVKGAERPVIRIYGNNNIDEIVADFCVLLKHFCSQVMIRSARINYNPLKGRQGTFPLKLYTLNDAEIWIDDILPKECHQILNLAGFSESDYKLIKEDT